MTVAFTITGEDVYSVVEIDNMTIIDILYTQVYIHEQDKWLYPVNPSFMYWDRFECHVLTFYLNKNEYFNEIAKERYKK